MTPYNYNYDRNQYYDLNSNENDIYNSNPHGNYRNLYPGCSDYDQQLINSCVYMLMELDVFQQTAGLLEKLTMWNLFKKSRDELLNICDAYNLYTECIGGKSMKERCYYREPFRSRYAAVDNSLSYVCGEGYPSLYTSWNCIQEVLTGITYMECINIVKAGQKMNYNQPLPNFLSACSNLQAYVHCIRPAIESRCGRRAYLAVLMTIRHSGETLFPHCTLAAKWYTYSVTLQVVSVIIVYFFSSILK